jgi:hypothetical protein
MAKITANAIIPCELKPEVTGQIEAFVEHLTEQAQQLAGEMTPEESAIMLHAAVERMRGRQAASMATKRSFIGDVLEALRAAGRISRWDFVGSGERHDYEIGIGDRTIIVEAKGCLDGNNTNIFQRPANADEFYIWSLCQNPGSDPRHNVWSGVHSRLSAEVIARRTLVDGLIVWDMLCGTVARPCPKVEGNEERLTTLGPRRVPPPCIYLFPRTIPDPRNNAKPPVWRINELRFASALHEAFKGDDAELTSVLLSTSMDGAKVKRTTVLVRNGETIATSKDDVIKRARF